MADEFNQDEAAAQGENPEAAASAEDSNADASTDAAQNADASSDASADNAPVDPIDAELADLVDATGPISKERLKKAGFPYQGHTDFLASLTSTQGVTMMLATGSH